jgi:hypothetical protein
MGLEIAIGEIDIDARQFNQKMPYHDVAACGGANEASADIGGVLV